MTRELVLSNGVATLVDDADYAWLSQWNWHMRGSQGYVRRNRLSGETGPSTIRLHRVILNAPAGMDVDHINGNPLDNRRCNLRLATRLQNVRNRHRTHGSSRFKGVAWIKPNHKWRAQIRVHGANVYLGYFTDEAEAARAYDRAAREHFGQFASCNFQEG